MGTVFTTDQRGAYVDIGAKGQAFVPMEELSLSKVDRVCAVHTHVYLPHVAFASLHCPQPEAFTYQSCLGPCSKMGTECRCVCRWVTCSLRASGESLSSSVTMDRTGKSGCP